MAAVAAVTSRSPARELLRDVLGDVVDRLDDRGGRLLATLYSAARCEIEKAERHEHQLEFDAA